MFTMQLAPLAHDKDSLMLSVISIILMTPNTCFILHLRWSIPKGGKPFFMAGKPTGLNPPNQSVFDLNETADGYLLEGSREQKEMGW